MHPYYGAAIPDPWDILGVRLRPFSLGHVVLLNRIESPFIVGGTLPTFDDLAFAVLVCSKNYEDGLRSIEDPNLPKILRQWADRLTGLKRWMVRCRLKTATPVDFAKSALEFFAYIKEHSTVPKYEYNPDHFHEMSCPDVQMVKVTLMREMRFGESEILNRNWGLCLWDWVTMRALDGKVKLVNEDNYNEAREIANQLFKKLRGANA